MGSTATIRSRPRRVGVGDFGREKGADGRHRGRAKKWIFPLRENKFLRWDDRAGIKESRWEEDDVVLHGDVSSPNEAIASSADGALPLSAENVALPDVSRSAQGNARDETASQSSVVAQANGQAGSTSGQTPLPVAKRRYYVVSMVWKERADEGTELQSDSGMAVKCTHSKIDSGSHEPCVDGESFGNKQNLR